MSELAAFNVGFTEGWHSAPRQKTLGPTYQHAYDRGREARDREDNGGEDVAAARGKGQR